MTDFGRGYDPKPYMEFQKLLAVYVLRSVWPGIASCM